MFLWTPYPLPKCGSRSRSPMRKELPEISKILTTDKKLNTYNQNDNPPSSNLTFLLKHPLLPYTDCHFMLYAVVGVKMCH